ncbi:MAG: YesL family protein [Clostridiales bacterium]|nr:YesL family protein [Clostridiales bacterium]
MLQEFFNYDNPVWRFIGKFFDVFLLNILWMVCCIPIVTAGAATTAVYYVTMKLVRDEDGSTIRQYFKSFKENFKQATAIWLILLAVLAVIGFDLYFAVMLPRETPYRTVMMAVFVGFALIWSAISLYVAPLQATFYNPVKRTIFNAFFISIRHFPATLGMLVIDWAIPLTAFMAAAFLQPVVFIFGFPLVAFLNSFVMVGIFERYMPKEDHEEHEDQEEV